MKSGNYMKKNKIVFLICIVIIGILIFEIISYIKNVIEVSALNNMYKDIKTLEDKIALYYLDNGKLPVKTDIKIDFFEKSINPNDGEFYYEVDLDKLENITLSYGYKRQSVDDIYIINEESHTVYYMKGCKRGDQIIYSRELQYKYVDLENY